MSHAEMDQLYELYVLGVLEREEAIEIDAHLEDDCPYCQERVRAALGTVAGLSALAEMVDPPKTLRERVLSSVRPARRARPSGPWMVAIAGLSAACAALLVFSLWSTAEMQRMRDRVSALTGERDELRSAVQILTTADTREIQGIRQQLMSVRDERNRLRSLIAVLARPDTRVVEFGRGQNAPHGRVFVNGAGGLVLVGSDLPVLASDKIFELWLIPAKGAPEPAGLFRPNTAGEFVHVSPVPVDGSKAVAVTIEPRQGSSAPTTKPFLVVPLG